MDTICAISTPLGISGIGIIRLSGPDTYRIIEEIFVPGKNPFKKKKFKVDKIPSHTVIYGHIVDDGRVIDEVLVTIMKSPRTYTREDMAEIGCHGGIVPLKQVLNLCIKKGARLAQPGEFTKRAFLNGRIDLTQAESILEIIYSKTETGLEMGIKKLKGSLSDLIDKIRKRILKLLSIIEAKINFPEEEDVEKFEFEIKEEIEKVINSVENILSRTNKGKIIQNGINAAIIGSPNVGKSSLLNTFLREERAIVTEIPGTTTDAICEIINIKGIPVNIIDTAGIRETKGKIEKMGVEKALEWMEKAEINLIMFDGSRKLNEYDYKLIENIKKKPHIVIINKIDLPLKIEMDVIEKKFSREWIVKTSLKNGVGIEEVEGKLWKLINEGYGEIKGEEIYLNLRQENKMKKIRDILVETVKEEKMENWIEIIAENLRACLNIMDEITGKKITEEILDEIFSNFCIGK